jgi:glutamine amidotransferase
MLKVAVIDYDSGNVRSVQRALQHAAGTDFANVEITSDAAKIQAAQAVVFPGQGAAGQSMRNLRQSGLDQVVIEQIQSGKPFMGVCVGLQLLFTHLEENDTLGLGVVEGEVPRFRFDNSASANNPTQERLKVPQIGWNRVRQVGRPSLLWEGVPNDSYFYFVHSYYAAPASDTDIIGLSDYGPDFCSAVARDNWFATQFHPEKSGSVGLRVYANFLRFAATC